MNFETPMKRRTIAIFTEAEIISTLPGNSLTQNPKSHGGRLVGAESLRFSSLAVQHRVFRPSNPANGRRNPCTECDDAAPGDSLERARTGRKDRERRKGAGGKKGDKEGD